VPLVREGTTIAHEHVFRIKFSCNSSNSMKMLRGGGGGSGWVCAGKHANGVALTAFSVEIDFGPK
jgi:hypothetical protein